MLDGPASKDALIWAASPGRSRERSDICTSAAGAATVCSPCCSAGEHGRAASQSSGSFEVSGEGSPGAARQLDILLANLANCSLARENLGENDALRRSAGADYPLRPNQKRIQVILIIDDFPMLYIGSQTKQYTVSRHAGVDALFQS